MAASLTERLQVIVQITTIYSSREVEGPALRYLGNRLNAQEGAKSGRDRRQVDHLEDERDLD